MLVPVPQESSIEVVGGDLLLEEGPGHESTSSSLKYLINLLDFTLFFIS